MCFFTQAVLPRVAVMLAHGRRKGKRRPVVPPSAENRHEEPTLVASASRAREDPSGASLSPLPTRTPRKRKRAHTCWGGEKELRLCRGGWVLAAGRHAVSEKAYGRSLFMLEFVYFLPNISTAEG